MWLVLFLLVIILSLYIAFRFDGIYHKVITAGTIISLFSVLLFHDHTILTISYFIFFIMQIATFLYGVMNKQLRTLDGISIVTMGLFFTIKSTIQLFHYPFVNESIASLILPAGLFLIAFIYDRKMRKELSFMIFWFCYAVYEIVNMYLKNLHNCG